MERNATKKYDFDRVVRMVITIVCVGVGIYLINYLTPVLLPFLLGFILAYVLDPIVRLVARITHIRSRGVNVILALLLVIGVLTLAGWLVIPYVAQEVVNMTKMLAAYAKASFHIPYIPAVVQEYIRQYVGFTDINGAKIIWINAVWEGTFTDLVSKDIVRTSGGCGHYWSIKVNLDTEKVYGLEVNESGDTKYIPRNKKPGPRISKPKNQHKPQRIRKTGIMHNPSEVTF